MNAVLLPVRQGTPEWLTARRSGIGSSDAPVIAGERGSAVALWAEKTGLVNPTPVDPATQRFFDRGHRLEPVVAAWYTDETGRPLKRLGHPRRHPDVPWAFASLDRVSARRGERRVVEIKTSHFARWGETPEGVPPDVYPQVQHQLWVMAWDVADVVALTGGLELRIVEVPRDDAYIADLVELETEFWRSVETRQRPAVDGSEQTRRTLGRLWPRERGDLITAPSTKMDALARRLRDAKANAKAAADVEATLENAIRALLAEAPGVIGDGYKVTWLRNRDSTRTDWHAVAEGLREVVGPGAFDRTVAAHTTTSEGARVLRAVFREQERSEAA
jgi:putative phage-type endonuclease